MDLLPLITYFFMLNHQDKYTQNTLQPLEMKINCFQLG